MTQTVEMITLNQMISLKTHTKPINEHTDIDRYLLVPKKNWGDFEIGDLELKINGINIKTRVYDVFCECVTPKHNHRIIDLRDMWSKLDLKENIEVEVER